MKNIRSFISAISKSPVLNNVTSVLLGIGVLLLTGFAIWLIFKVIAFLLGLLFAAVGLLFKGVIIVFLVLLAIVLVIQGLAYLFVLTTSHPRFVALIIFLVSIYIADLNLAMNHDTSFLNLSEIPPVIRTSINSYIESGNFQLGLQQLRDSFIELYGKTDFLAIGRILFSEFHSNIATELLGIVLTVIVFDAMYRKQDEQASTSQQQKINYLEMELQTTRQTLLNIEQKLTQLVEKDS